MLTTWVVVQQRIDNLTDFGRNWSEYRNGFGVYNFNYSMGLEKMNQLRNSSNYKLRIEVYYSARGRPRQKLLDWMMSEGYGKLKEEAQNREKWSHRTAGP